MGKVRVFALAKQLGLQSQALVAALAKLGIEATPATPIDEETATAARELLAEQARVAREAVEVAAQAAVEAAEDHPVAVAEPTPEETAVEPLVVEGKVEDKTDEDVTTKEDRETEKYFRRRGPSRLEEEDGLAELERQLAELEAQEEAERARRARAGQVVPLPEMARRPSGPRPEGAVTVPPVVTVLGHVDHGKTSLLDAVRKTDVVSGESGGITQHIGASEASVGDRKIVFVDTPGHEAFTAMRARGAMVTDVAVLVVAANEGIMPQTVEAMNHAKAAGVPIIVAVNKIDLPDANPDMVKQQLLEHQLVPEDWGGETIVVPVSATRGDGIDDLLEMILLVADVQELWADPNADFVGIVVESSVDVSQGTICTILVRNGTIRVGDAVVCGAAHGRVRRLRDWQGRSITEMGPGSPVEVVGLTGVPEAGEIVTRVKTPREARRIAEERQAAAREAELSGIGGVALRDIFQEVTGAGKASLNVIIKGDVWGTVQALEAKLLDLDRRLDELDVNIVSSGVGDISESDIMLAKASEAIIIGFHVNADTRIRHAAETEGVELRTYEVIYEALEDIEHALLGLLAPVYEDVLLGKAEVLQLFRISRVGVIAGCTILEGRVQRGAEMRVMRNGEEIYRGRLESLRHFDRDVRTVESPNQCGISTPDWRGWEPGDLVEVWDRVAVERTLPFRDEQSADRG